VKRVTIAMVLAVGWASPMALAQSPAEVERHVEAARQAAGGEHVALFDRICTEAQTIGTPRPPRAGGRGEPRPTPPRESWHAEPVQVFDNLYYVGMTEYSAWAVATSDGIILIDAIFDYSIEDEVVDGLTALGFDPADIKYVVISHAHLDHAGGAKLLQQRYGTKVVMAQADSELLDEQDPAWKPARDMVANDGDRLTLGDTTVTLYLTPGHTEGTISTLVPVRDRGRSHLAAAWGGTAFNFGPNRERLEMYAASAERFRDIVEQAGADVLIANHTNFDGSKSKIPALATRQPGDPHPYVIGTDAVSRYLTVADECAQAALAGL